MTRLQKSLLFSLTAVLCILLTVLVLEIVQPGGYQGIRGLFGVAEISEDLVEVETPETPTPPPITPTPPPSMPGEEHMPREDIEAESPPPDLPALVGITQAESASQIFANTGDVIRFGNFDWRVLDRQGAVALVISESVILRQPYHESLGEVTWASSSIRYVLNTAFFDSFHQNDRQRILDTPVTTSSNPWFGTSGGETTIDRLFLLSIEETVRFFGDSGQLGSRTVPQDWQNPDAWYINDEFNGERLAGGVMWWLRSPGSNANRVAAVSPLGMISVRGDMSPSIEAGIRPAMWIHLGVDAPTPPILPTPPGITPTPAPPVLPPHPDAGILRVGDEYTFGGHDFLVLDVRGREALILMKNITIFQRYHFPTENVNWQDSSIRAFLNNEFLSTFTQAEVNRLLWANFEKNEIETLDNPWFGTYGGRDDYDLVFLLCIEQVLRYLGDSGFVEIGTNPAMRTAMWPNIGIHLWGVHDGYDRVAYDLDGFPQSWWLRNPGFYPTDAAFIEATGAINIIGAEISSTNIGIRPAMWITF